MVRKRNGALRLITVMVTSAVVMVGCSSTDAVRSGMGGAAKGVPYGASIEDYKAAFADVTPIKLYMQSSSPAGSVNGKPYEDYAAALTEWSGGKITVDMAYSNAVASAKEVDNALLDGRLDVASIIPAYNPSEYPANAALNDASVNSQQSPIIGALQSSAWPLEMYFKTPVLQNEMDKKGLHLLLPAFNSGSVALFCKKPLVSLNDLQGTVLSADSPAKSKQMAGLGGSPISLGYSELFDSLQRGVIQCGATTLAAAVLGGIVPAAPHAVIDPTAGLANTSGAIAISQSKWESLPVVAQQLLFDRVDVLMKQNLLKLWAGAVEGSKAIATNKGEFAAFSPDAHDALVKANKGIVDDLGKNLGKPFVDSIYAASDHWTSQIKGDLGYSDTVGYADFATWYTPEKVNLTKYLDAVFTQILLPHRPS